MRDDSLDSYLDAGHFPFPALAALAADDDARRRDAALATFMAARLALDLTLARRAAPRARAARSAAARKWLAALPTLPAASRIPLARVADASAGASLEPVVAALSSALDALRPLLNSASVAEAESVVERLSSLGKSIDRRGRGATPL